MYLGEAGAGFAPHAFGPVAVGRVGGAQVALHEGAQQCGGLRLGRFFGVDFAQHMIDYANQTAKDEGVSDKCNFVLGDVLTYDFGGKTFDYAYALGVFDYVQDAQALLSRMSNLSRHSFMASWPEDGLRMALRRYRYTCPLFHYTEQKIIDLHKNAGISRDKLEIIRIGGGWATVAHK